MGGLVGRGGGGKTEEGLVEEPAGAGGLCHEAGVGYSGTDRHGRELEISALRAD